MRESKGLALAAGLTAAAIWGGMYVVSKVVLESVPPFCLLSLRLALGFLVLAPLALARGQWRFSARQAWTCLGVGFVGYGLSLGCQFVGTSLSGAADAAMITSATPALVAPFALWLLGEKPGRRGGLALALASLGVAAIVVPQGGLSAAASLPGDLLLLAAALSWALYSVLVARVGRGLGVAALTALLLVGGLPSSLGLGAVELAGGGLGPIGPGVVAGVLFLGIVATALAMGLWNFAFVRLGANTAALTFFAQPVVGSALAIVCLGERPTPAFGLGAALIAAGLALQALPARGGSNKSEVA